MDLTLAMPETYTPTSSPDDYRCVLIDWPLGEGTGDEMCLGVTYLTDVY